METKWQITEGYGTEEGISFCLREAMLMAGVTGSVGATVVHEATDGTVSSVTVSKEGL